MNLSAKPVDARVRYINAEWRDRDDSPHIGSKESRRANTSYQPKSIHDARERLAAGDIDLDRNDFTLTSHETSVADFRDEEQMKSIYGISLSGFDYGLNRSYKVGYTWPAPLPSRDLDLSCHIQTTVLRTLYRSETWLPSPHLMTVVVRERVRVCLSLNDSLAGSYSWVILRNLVTTSS